MELSEQSVRLVDWDGEENWRHPKTSRLHRTDGPAVILPNGDQIWWLDGLIHREHGPAVVRAHGALEWWHLDKRHRLDGPAIQMEDGEEWWQQNERHRLDGPAIMWPDGRQQWYVHGICVTDQVLDWMRSRVVTWPWSEEVQMEFLLTFA